MSALILSVMVAVFATALVVVWTRSQRVMQAEYIRTYMFPAGLFEKLRTKRPELAVKDCQLIAHALRQLFLAHLKSACKFVSMPSQVADDLWHELFSTSGITKPSAAWRSVASCTTRQLLSSERTGGTMRALAAPGGIPVWKITSIRASRRDCPCSLRSMPSSIFPMDSSMRRTVSSCGKAGPERRTAWRFLKFLLLW